VFGTVLSSGKTPGHAIGAVEQQVRVEVFLHELRPKLVEEGWFAVSRLKMSVLAMPSISSNEFMSASVTLALIE
jgi:hypothetical protein